MIRTATALVLGLLVCPVLSSTRGDCAPISEQDVQSIAADAYVYLYPLVMMDVTRKQLTNMAPGKGVFGGPMNMFANVETFPPADFKVVVRPNFDTLYSSAFLDLTKEPVVVAVPNTKGRYYLLPMLDM